MQNQLFNEYQSYIPLYYRYVTKARSMHTSTVVEITILYGLEKYLTLRCYHSKQLVPPDTTTT
jgi:hypothetical protein